MNITPLEIRQKVFEKAFRGYDKDEVSAFLNSLSIEWEKLNDQSKELKYKLEASEKEVQKLREVENSLFKTLKTAEDTGANMIEQATKTAELHMKETEMNADALMSEAKSRAKSIIEDAENRAKMIIDDMEDEIRQLEQVYRGLDANKVSLMSELKNLANDILDKLNRHGDFPTDIKPHLKKAKDLSREVNESNTQEEAVKSILKMPVSEAAPVEESPVDEPVNEFTLDPEPEALVANTDESETSFQDEATDTTLNSESEVSSSEENHLTEDAEDDEDKEKGSFFDQFD
jgi:cell division initiation protein